MGRKLDSPGGDRLEACHRAALALKEQHGSVNKAAIATGLKQQTLNNLVTDRTLGIEFADKIAAVFGTTVDGLVRMFVRDGGGAVRAGDIRGWRRAATEAAEQYGDLPFDTAAETILPVAPSEATRDFVYDLAHVFRKHVRELTTGASDGRSLVVPGGNTGGDVAAALRENPDTGPFGGIKDSAHEGLKRTATVTGKPRANRKKQRRAT